MEFNEAKYKECDGDHDYGWNENAGSCVHCGLIHNCEVENKYESSGDHYICSVCHIFPSQQVLKEIEQANADARDRDLEFRRAIL